MILAIAYVALRSLVSRLVSEGWTVEQARGAAQRFKETAEPPPWRQERARAWAPTSALLRNQTNTP